MSTATLQSGWRHLFEAWRKLNRIQFAAPWARKAR
jgi:hypothetical protein